MGFRLWDWELFAFRLGLELECEEFGTQAFGFRGPFGLTVRVSGVRTVDLGESVGAPPKSRVVRCPGLTRFDVHSVWTARYTTWICETQGQVQDLGFGMCSRLVCSGLIGLCVCVYTSIAISGPKILK